MTEIEFSDNTNNWGLRSYADDPDSKQWGGGNVYDVYQRARP